MLQEAMLIPKQAHAGPSPPPPLYHHPCQLPKSSIFQYLTPTLEGMWKTSPGGRKQKTKIQKHKKQQQKNLGWFPRSSSVKPGWPPAQVNTSYRLWCHRSALWSSSHLLSEASAQHCNYTPTACSLQHQAGVHPSSLLCSGPLILLYKALTGQVFSHN